MLVKAVLALDSFATQFGGIVSNREDGIKCLFLPRIISILQPMDQGLI